MPRSIWKGSISFGMVAIPVKMFTVSRSKSVSFHLLHKSCKSRVKNRRYCPHHEKEVGADELVRAYEYARNHYVVMEDEDFDNLPVPSKHSIDLTAFVEMKEVDPVYFEKSYYLEPDEAGKKPYALLMRALEKKNLVGLAKITIHEKEHLCALRPMEGTLVLETLYYPDEVTVEKGVAAKTSISDKELDMAFTLIDILKEDKFDPNKYQDEYRKALLERIEAKIQGREVETAPDEEPAPTKVIDLMAALKASVEAAKKGGSAAKKEPEPREDDEEEEEEDKPKKRKKAG